MTTLFFFPDHAFVMSGGCLDEVNGKGVQPTPRNL